MTVDFLSAFWEEEEEGGGIVIIEPILRGLPGFLTTETS